MLWEVARGSYERFLAVVSGVLVGFRGTRFGFLRFDYGVVVVVAVVFLAGVDAAVRLAMGNAIDIGLSFEAALAQSLVSGLLLLAMIDGVRRSYVVFRPQELHQGFLADPPQIVQATGRFASEGREDFRYFEAASVRDDGTKLVMVSPPRLAHAPPTNGISSDTVDDVFFATVDVQNRVGSPPITCKWIEINAWQVTRVETGLIRFGFLSSPAVRFVVQRRSGSEQFHLSVATDGQARWLFEWTDVARRLTPPR